MSVQRNLPKDIEVLKTEKIKELTTWHDEQIELAKSKYSKAEIEAFPEKSKEAMAYTADNTVPAPYLLGMVGGDATLLPALVNAIMAKVNASAYLDGQVDILRDAIQVCTTQAELDAITW